MKYLIPFGLPSVSFLICFSLHAQPKPVELKVSESSRSVDVFVDGKFFTAYRYPRDLEKPVLFPLLTAAGTPVTRGYPLAPRAGERVDHPHHVGMWFNFGDVNGLDFWNNSYAIPENERHKYGRVAHQAITSNSGGREGLLSVRCDWIDSKGQVLLKEQTEFRFSGDGELRFIDRKTTLIAVSSVTFTDNKEGLLAIRMDRAFEEPVTEPEVFTDAAGRPTTVATMNNDGVNGLYRSANGLSGGSVWGTRADWVSLTAKKGTEEITVAMIDHPDNFGYPAHWHARTYGLFSVNNIGSRVFSATDPVRRLNLVPGSSVTFRHRLVMGPAGLLGNTEMNQISSDFRSN